MKKLAVLLAVAIAGLSLASCTTEDSVVYYIHNVVEVDFHETTGFTSSPAKQIYDDYIQALIDFDAKYEGTSAWNWTVTVKNGKFSNADSDAIAKFKTYESELSEIYAEYAEKFQSCSDPDFNCLYECRFYLVRYSYDEDKDLAEYKYSIEY